MAKFKIGDKVRITGLVNTEIENGLDSKMLKIGDRGIITDHRTNAFKIEGFWYNIKDLELVITDVNYILLPDSVTVAFDGQLHTIKTGDHRHAQIIKAIKEERLEAIPELVDVARSFSSIEGVELVDGRIKLNGKDIPEVVSDRVLKFKEQGLPFEPLVKFSEKLLKNPSFNSRKMLYRFLEHNGHPITKDGNFIAYRKVRKDFTDCHTGKMDNSLGTIVEMDRNEVDDNPDNTCSSGLHVAAYEYAKDFSSGHLLEVEIDPEDVVAVPNDYDGQKMRVCKFRVVKICESKLEEELYDEDDEDEYAYDCIWCDDFGCEECEEF